ncbi:MAG: pyridine nucleotide-disulfide oxidoreductase [Legionella sp.]|nr:pyridine nucleotide-disulfide oxidoreductase [Legionella sp.]
MIAKQWSVIGAGPSGILAVAKLIDSGISPKHISWIDPTFTVGDLSDKWSEVPSNTIVKLFVDYIKDMQCINLNLLSQCELFDLPDNETCYLSNVVTPLQQCTQQLKPKVHAIKDNVTHLELKNRFWHIKLCNRDSPEEIKSNNIILANGATPSEFKLNTNAETIPLNIALSPKKLKNYIKRDDSIAVFGSSHSAILILKNLVDLNTTQIINFYLSPCQYALNLGDWTLFDNTGLKGSAARWAKENIDGQLPDNLMRIISNEKNINQYLPTCNKIITATGFKANDSIQIKGVNSNHYQPQTGIIAPGLFGLGIAYPEKTTNDFGIAETKVGLWKFATYLKKILPIWLKYSA